MPDGTERPSMSLTHLPLGDVARILAKSGAPSLTEDMVREDLEAGAPCNPDGTINLISYTAWLVRALADGD
jgi:hypothetical protein